MAEHVENCALIRSGGKKGVKGKTELEGDKSTFPPLPDLISQGN